jgi:uncharacterized coiled-coil protein SlyX
VFALEAFLLPGDIKEAQSNYDTKVAAEAANEALKRSKAKKKGKKDKKKKKIIDKTVPKHSQERVGSCNPNSPVDSSLNFASVVLPTGTTLGGDQTLVEAAATGENPEKLISLSVVPLNSSAPAVPPTELVQGNTQTLKEYQTTEQKKMPLGQPTTTSGNEDWIAQLLAEHKQTMAEHKKTVGDLIAKHEAEHKKTVADHEQTVANLIAKHEADHKKTVADHEQTVAEHKKTMANLMAKHEQTIAEHEQTVAENKKTVTELISQNISLQETLKSVMSDKIDEIALRSIFERLRHELFANMGDVGEYANQYEKAQQNSEKMKIAFETLYGSKISQKELNLISVSYKSGNKAAHTLPTEHLALKALHKYDNSDWVDTETKITTAAKLFKALYKKEHTPYV